MCSFDRTRTARAPGLLLVSTALLLGGSCSPPAERTGPRLVLLVASCSVNKDVLSPYVPNRYTPSFERLGAESVVFRRHQTEAGQSGIAYASIVSGSQADVHGIYSHPGRLSDDLVLIGEAFADGGYETWFYSGHRMASADLNYGQGFPPERVIELKGRDKWDVLHEGDPHFREILDGLQADPEKRAFVLANFTLTHSPYTKQIGPGLVQTFCERFPEEALGVTADEIREYSPIYEDERFGLQWDFDDTVARLGLDKAGKDALVRVVTVTYKAAAVQLDGHVGRMLDTLRERGLLDETLVVFTADHGETSYRENALYQWMHGFQLAPDVLGVPWILRWPEIGGGSWEHVTRSIDVFPTLAGLCSLSLPPGVQLQGTDLSPALRGEVEIPELLAFSHTTVMKPESLETFADSEPVMRYYPRSDPELVWCAVRDWDRVYKLRNLDGTNWGIEVFDLGQDPSETTNLYDPEDPFHAEMAARLEGYKRSLVEHYRAGEAPDDALERLRELGYAE